MKNLRDCAAFLWMFCPPSLRAGDVTEKLSILLIFSRFWYLILFTWRVFLAFKVGRVVNNIFFCGVTNSEHTFNIDFRRTLIFRNVHSAQVVQQIVMNLVTTHPNCTSPMDYISQHALHSHIPVHHYTNHTAVTIHSSTLIASPHLHLIHSLT